MGPLLEIILEIIKLIIDKSSNEQEKYVKLLNAYANEANKAETQIVATVVGCHFQQTPEEQARRLEVLENTVQAFKV